MKDQTLKALAASVCGAVLAYFKIMLVPLAILLIVMLADYVSGMIKAWMRSELSSRIGIRGIVKKLCYALVIVVATCVDWLLAAGLNAVGVEFGRSYYIGVVVTIWLIINELISILENLSAVGVPLPGFLKNIVARLKNSVEAAGERKKEEKS